MRRGGNRVGRDKSRKEREGGGRRVGVAGGSQEWHKGRSEGSIIYHLILIVTH